LATLKPIELKFMPQPKAYVELWKLVGKAIVERPDLVFRFLQKHGIRVSKKDDSAHLTDGVIFGLQRNDKTFNHELTKLLSSFEKENQFIGAIAQAVGAVAGAVGSGQQKRAAKASAKAMKEQARAQTLSSVLALKAQQDANRLEELKLRQKSKGLDNKTLSIIIGVVVALLIIGLVYYQKTSLPKTVPITQPIKK
jgi:hypothetical protein